uniref:Uncharacterized protein n=1 Tax=Cacopsylla melanoneura TaxID=428564 RepID=A0A8D8ZE68_9HEMI
MLLISSIILFVHILTYLHNILLGTYLCVGVRFHVERTPLLILPFCLLVGSISSAVLCTLHHYSAFPSTCIVFPSISSLKCNCVRNLILNFMLFLQDQQKMESFRYLLFLAVRS